MEKKGECMPIPNNLTKQNVLDAIEYIEQNGVPDRNQSTKYDVVSDSGKKYPPKYVVAVANHLANKVDISGEEFTTIEANNFLKKLGILVESRQEKFELRITADSVISTDENFDIDNLNLGNNYKTLNTYFMKANGEKITRKYNKGERRNSNQTMPRIAFQIFERQIAALSREEKEEFPICQYSPKSEVIRGIYPSVERYKENRNTYEYLIYYYDEDRQFVIYCWNVFSTILFVQECLRRFGEPGDTFVLTYREKDRNEESSEKEADVLEKQEEKARELQNKYSKLLLDSKNIIFRGAPGTGKTYLAKEIATDIISNGYYDDYNLLSQEQKEQIEFVQFHPSYDYTDFVEGLRPVVNNDGSMGFELQDGVFKRFVEKARKNYEDSKKSQEVIEKETSAQEIMDEYFEEIINDEKKLKIKNGREFSISNIDEKNVYIEIESNKISNKLKLKVSEFRRMLESEESFEQVKDVTRFLSRSTGFQDDSYLLAIYKDIKEYNTSEKKVLTRENTLKPYIFIIDEINRGEISKIFGELFFSVDPGYRGPAGEVSTQYANLHDEVEKKFYIPENLYIIGTMNDIDRSVDSFDFAMRRRFRFVEIKADERLEMLDSLGEEKKKDAIRRMTALNEAISADEELNENYHIGASYFLKLKHLEFEDLWTDYLCPLLQDYVRGMYDEKGRMENFAKAYGYVKTQAGEEDDTTEDQG